MHIDTVGSSKCGRCCKPIQDVFLNSARKEKSEGKSMVLKCTSNDTDQIRHHCFIVTLIDSVDNDDHGLESPRHRSNWIDDQFSELAFMRPMDDHIVRKQDFFDVLSHFWDGECQFVRQCRS